MVPYPIDWDDRDRFHYFGGYVLGVAKQMGLNIRWGGDWNQDTQSKDIKFDDDEIIPYDIDTLLVVLDPQLPCAVAGDD